MLTENEVVAAMTVYLQKNNYNIVQSCATHQKGVDIIATHATHHLYIEAKGGTSSKEESARYGLAFDDNQIKTHVSRAVLQSMLVLQDKPAGPKTKVGIALPDTPGHRTLIDAIIKPIKSLGIKVFWVLCQDVTLQP